MTTRLFFSPAIALLITAVATVSPASQPPLLAESRDPYPDADLVQLDQIVRLRYETDGSYNYTSQSAYRILTEKGRQDRSTVRAYYNAAYGSARFDQVEIIKPNGETIPVDIAAQSREGVETGQMDANIFDPNQRAIVLTIPGLEIGDVLRFTISGERNKPVVPGTWSDWFSLEAPWPIERAVYEINGPDSLPLLKTKLRDEIPGTVSFRQRRSDGRILYRWEAREIPQMFEEPQMPSRHTVGQRLLLSTIEDWESLSRWYWNLSEPRLLAVNDPMRQKVAELTEGLSDPSAKIRALFRFVSQDIRYMGITIEDEAPGYEPHDVSLTFDNRYGVCRDKAALLVALLNLAGFEARPVLIYVGPKKDPEVPQPWFNHAITAVRDESGEWLLMDPTDENTRDLLPAYLSDRSYLVASPEGETLQTSPVTPPEENLLAIEIDASLDSRHLIQGTASLQFNGIHDTAYRGRLARLKPAEREPFFEERLKQAFGRARLLRLDISPADVRDTETPLQISLRFEIEDALADGGSDAVLQPPTLLNHLGLFGRLIAGGIGLEQRRFPLQVQVTCGIRETVRLDLRQSGLRVAQLPAYETVDTPELLMHREIEAADGLLTARAAVLLRTVEFSPEQYLTLKQNLKVSERNARRRVVLGRDGFPPEADLAILDEQVVYTLRKPGEWQEERSLRIQVLSYAGKKEIADLRLPFNPAVCQLWLEKAETRLPNGTVRRIDPDTEINLMDDYWTASAPRYPAGKILAVSLPAVETGSIVETKTVRMMQDLPFFSATELFAGFHPIVSKTVQVRIPLSMDIHYISTSPGQIRHKTWHEGTQTVHEWSALNQPMIRKEEHMPPGWTATAAPALLLSCGDLSSYTRDLHRTLLDAASRNKIVRSRARDWTSGLKTRSEKIQALRDAADRLVREAGPSLHNLPLSAITPADRILAEGYANTTDRAVLLYALLDAARLKPRFILTSDLPRYSHPSIPPITALQRNAFGSLLVAVDDDNKQPVYLGDTGQYAVLGTTDAAGRPSVDLRTGTVFLPEAQIPNRLETAYLIVLDDQGNAQITRRARYSGTAGESFHRMFAQFTPEQRRREHQRLLSRLSQSATAASDLVTCLESGLLEFSANVPSFALLSGDRMNFTLPETIGNVLALRSSRRENPFYIQDPVDQILSFEIIPPEGWSTAVVPETFSLLMPADAGAIFSQTVESDLRLQIVQRAHILPAIIPAEEYTRLLHIHGRLNAPSAETVLLRKQPVNVAPARRNR